MTKYFYDTNACLELQDKIFESPFVISSKTLEEIENIKTSDRKDADIKYKARRLARLLDSYSDKYQVAITFQDNNKTIDNFNLSSSPDTVILSSAYVWNLKEPIVFVSDDVNCKVLGREIFGLTVKGIYDEQVYEKYTGFKEVIMTDEEMASFYERTNENKYNCLINEYLIIKSIHGVVVDHYRWNGNKYVSASFKTIPKDFIEKVAPINLHQKLAFDMLQNRDVTIKALTGKAGSGKDYIMIANALNLIKNNKINKIIWVRNNIEVKNTKPIGFLPGTYKEKLMSYAKPLADHLGGEHGLDMFIREGKIELEHLGLMRGRNIENSIIYCSESENMTKEHIQVLIGRLGQGSELWMNGDYRQVDDKVFESNNGLKTSIEKLKGNLKFGFVELQQVERSETAMLAELLN
jgi:PhoH-like ATPase